MPLPETQKWSQQVTATTATCFSTCPLHPFSNTTESWMTSTLHVFHQFTLIINHSLLPSHFLLSASIDVSTLLPTTARIAWTESRNLRVSITECNSHFRGILDGVSFVFAWVLGNLEITLGTYASAGTNSCLCRFACEPRVDQHTSSLHTSSQS